MSYTSSTMYLAKMLNFSEELKRCILIVTQKRGLGSALGFRPPLRRTADYNHRFDDEFLRVPSSL